jgi:ATP-dependent DNA helicase RecQ
MPTVPVIALTASATLEVQNDICEKLLFSKNHQRFQQSFSRPNLSYSFIEPEAKETMLIDILKKETGSSIIYCKSRKQTQQITDLLHANEINADYYHAGLDPEVRMKKQMKWMNNEITSMVCTNAFGMGIDKPDVRLVLHLNIPENIESYYQEAGRAGRDGENSKAILLYHHKEADNLIALNAIKYPSPEKIKTIYLQLMNYLQVDAGVGEGLSFVFDIGQFANTYKMNILEADYGLKALSQEGLIFFLEKSSKPSELVFLASKDTLYEFKKNKPEYEDIINALLRNYEGIFDYSCAIHESLISKTTSLPYETIKKQLQALDHYQIVQYKPPSSGPQIILLKNRMYADDFKFDYVSLKKRSQKNIDRIHSMIDFVSNKNTCRSKYIGNYFNDLQIADCGICDSCINNKEHSINKIAFKELASLIISDLKKNKIPAIEVKARYHHFRKQAIEQTLYYLQSENLIIIDDEGNVTLTK